MLYQSEKEGVYLFYYCSNDAIQSKFDEYFEHIEDLYEEWNEYIDDKGLDTIESHTKDFIKTRLSDAYPKNDGKQTPTKNHPVFIAMHACGCCCRTCLDKWHNIPKDRELTETEIEYIVSLLIEWIKREIK